MIFWFSLWIVHSAMGQAALNVDLLGRWGEGHCRAVFRRNAYTFLSNGSYLQVHQYQDGNYERLDQILLPGNVQDIWALNTTVLVSLGDVGIRVVGFDPQTGSFGGILGALNTPGTALGLMQYGDYAFIADGDAGLTIIDVKNPNSPQYRNSIPLRAPAREVWVVNDSTVFVAADTAGLYSIQTPIPHTEIVLLDSLEFEDVVQNKPSPEAQHVIVIDTVAYISAGWGGLRTVDIRDPENLSELGRWTWQGTPVEVMQTWVVGEFAFVAAGDKGLFSRIDVSDPSDPKDRYLPNETDGVTQAVVVELDTAFIADGFNGHLVYEVNAFQPDTSIKSVPMADNALDAVSDGTHAFLADGQAGIKVFDLTIPVPPDEYLNALYTHDTPGESRGVAKRGNFLYVADGSRGMTILNTANPNALDPEGEFVIVNGDTCYDVAAGPTPYAGYVFIASGTDGIRVVDVSVPQAPLQLLVEDTPGKANAVEVSGDRIVVADWDRVNVYSITGVPNSMTLTHTLELDNMETRGIAIQGDSIFVANGRYGFLVWNPLTDDVDSLNFDGVCTDIAVRGKTIYLTDAMKGLRIFDFSNPGEFNEAGYYDTGRRPVRLDVSGDIICVANRESGLYVLESAIRPEISVAPTVLNFGPVPPSRSRSLSAWIMNTGTTELRVTGIDVNQDVFKFDVTSFHVAPGDTHSLVVRFEPGTGDVGDIIGAANIYSNADTIGLSLQGRVVSLIAEGPYDPDFFTVGLWHFDETAGATTPDASGNLLEGTLKQGVVRTDTARYSRSMRYTGQTDGYVEIDFQPVLNFHDNAFTMELWFQMSSKPDPYYILLKRGIGTTMQYELALAAESQDERGVMGRVQDALGNLHMVHTGSMDSLNTGQWYHVAMTWDRDTLKIFLNGLLKDAKPLRTNLIYQASEKLAFGASAYGNAPFHGYIDEVRISNIAREIWEYHVNRSRLAVEVNRIDFGNIVLNQSRSLPFTFRNIGSQAMVISSITSTSPFVEVPVVSDLVLEASEESTIWMTFTPTSVISLGGEQFLSIESTDPTFPVYDIALYGNGIVSMPAGAYATDPFTLGLWHFDESSGVVVFDSSGNELDGTWTGILRPAGKFGRSLRLDGQNDMCVIPVDGEQRIGAEYGGFSVENWFYMDAVPLDVGSLVRRTSPTASQFELSIDITRRLVGKVYNTENQAFTVSSGEAVTELRRWTHAAMTLDRDSLRLYVNGDIVDIVAFTGEMAGEQGDTQRDTLSILIGGDWGQDNLFIGQIDEVRISGVSRDWWEFNVNMARIAVSSNIMLFDRVLVGYDRTLNLTVSNEGIDTLFVGGLSIHGGAFLADDSGFKIGPGGSRIIPVTFRPVIAGVDTASLTLENTNDPYQISKSIHLTGTAVDAWPVVPYSPDTFTPALYHFEEGEGVTLLDASGWGFNGTLLGGAAWSTTGRFGEGLRFDGIDGRVQIPYDTMLDLSNRDFTVELWFYLLSRPTTRSVLFGRGAGQSRQIEIAFDAADGLTASVWDLAGTPFTLQSGSMEMLNLMQWYHVAFSWDGDSIRLRLNNQLQGTLALTGSLRNHSTKPFIIGADSALATPFHGLVDEFRISHIARSGWEINVLPPDIMVYPAALNFSTVLINESRRLQFWITNQGDQDLDVTSIDGINGPFLFPDSLRQITLYRLQTQAFPVTYMPTTANTTHRDTLIIMSNDVTQPIATVSLEGSGTEWTGPPPPPIVDSHTLTLFRFDEVEDNVISDVSGQGHNAVLLNGATLSDGYFSNGLFFDGVNDHADIAYHPDLDFNFASESFTFEWYFKTDTVSQVLFSQGLGDSVKYGVSISNLGRLEIAGFGNAGPVVSDGSWHHAAFSFNHITGEGRLYLDGDQKWSRIWNGISGNAMQRPLILGAAEQQAGIYTKFFEGTLDEFRISNIVREPWEFQLVDYGIEILSIDPSPPVYNEPLTLTISVDLVLEAEDVRLYYRNGGSMAYRSIPTMQTDATTYTATLPDSAVTLYGFEYYVTVVSRDDTLAYPGMDPVNNPLASVVRHPEMTSPVELAHRKHKMVSIPYLLDVTTVADVFIDDLGVYDPYYWRMFWWHNLDSVYADYTDQLPIDYYPLTPGRAYWIVTAQDRRFDVGAGQTVTTDSSYQIVLLRGWNMIGSPFGFPVAWEDCYVTSNLVGSLYYYDEEDGYRVDWPTFESWEGYFIYNASLENQSIFVRPKMTAPALVKPIQKGVLSRMDDQEWMFRISAEADGTKDLDNYAGVRRGASSEWDFHDRPEPPPVGNYISVGFDHPEWTSHRGRYAADVRPLDDEGVAWDFDVESLLSGKQVSMNWSLTQTLPEGWLAYLFDLDQGIAIDMLELEKIQFKTGESTPNRRRYRIVAGEKAFIEQNSDDIPLEPVTFQLQQNYPNPFNGETTIRYSVPEKCRGEIAIFNTLGQRIRLLRLEHPRAGHFEVVWDGRDARGVPVPSGMYVYRLQAADETATRKMIFIK